MQIQARFTHLRVATSRQHDKTPYKPALLLAVLDCIEDGSSQANHICTTPKLLAAFRTLCRNLSSRLYDSKRSYYNHTKRPALDQRRPSFMRSGKLFHHHAAHGRGLAGYLYREQVRAGGQARGGKLRGSTRERALRHLLA